MNNLTYSDSPFFSNWSQTYFTNLTLDQHIANNNWLMNTLTMLKDDGILYQIMSTFATSLTHLLKSLAC